MSEELEKRLLSTASRTTISLAAIDAERAEAAAELKAGRERIEALEEELDQLYPNAQGLRQRAEQAARDKALVDVERLEQSVVNAAEAGVRLSDEAIRARQDGIESCIQVAMGLGCPEGILRTMAALKETSGEQD